MTIVFSVSGSPTINFFAHTHGRMCPFGLGAPRAAHPISTYALDKFDLDERGPPTSHLLQRFGDWGQTTLQVVPFQALCVHSGWHFCAVNLRVSGSFAYVLGFEGSTDSCVDFRDTIGDLPSSRRSEY